MPKVLSLVNSVSSTSIPVEIANAINAHTSSHVTIGGVMENPNTDIDPDIQSMDLPLVFFSGRSNFDPWPYRRLQKHLRARDYDIVHTHHNFSGSVSRIIGRIQDITVVNTEHNDLQHFTIAQRAANVATFLLPDANVYNSYSTRSSLGPIEQCLSKRDEVIYNGVNIERIETSKDYPLPLDLPDGTLVTNVGVMTEQKNQQAILKAAYKVKQQQLSDDIQFVIAGSGPLENELRTIATQLQVDDIVTFTGYLPEREQIYSLLHKSDVFLNPSVYEGFCVAAVEAMACGLPVIASDIQVLREVIGENGIFVPYDDVDALSDQILEISLNVDTEDIEEKQNKLLARARNEFPLKQTAISYHNLYQDLI